MSDSVDSVVDPEQRISLLQFALVMPTMIAMSWADGKPWPPPDDPDPDAARFADRFLQVLGSVAGTPDLERLRAAVLAGDPTAVSTLDQMVRHTVERLPDLRKKQAECFDGESYPAAIEIGSGGAELAEAVGDPHHAMLFAQDCARSIYRLGDMAGTVGWYRRALAAAAEVHPPPLSTLSLCHDNISLALSALGQLDLALKHLEQARALETDPLNRLMIANHTAIALHDLGEYRRAMRLHRADIAALRALRPDLEALLAIFQDNLAVAAVGAGDYPTAIAALTDADERLARLGKPLDRYKNARSRNRVLAAQHDSVGARAAFLAAWQFAVQFAEVGDEQGFRLGLRAAVARLAAPDSPVWSHFAAALAANAAQDWPTAIDGFLTTAAAAGDAGDVLTHLRSVANAAGVLSDSSNRDSTALAVEYAAYARSSGFQYFLPQPIAAADVALSAMSRRGIDVTGTDADELRLTAEGLAYARLGLKLAAELDDPSDPRVPEVDLGPLLARLGSIAAEAGALDLAAASLREALQSASERGYRFGELIRGVALLGVLDQMPAERAAADELAVGLRARLSDPGADSTADLLVLTALAGRSGAPPEDAITDLRAAAALLERHRGRIPPGGARADLDITHPVYRGLLRSGAGSADEQFETLQHVRARRLMEQLSARSSAQLGRTGAAALYRPPGVVEAIELLGTLGTPTTLVDITVTGDGLRTYLVDSSGLRVVDTAGDVTPVTSAQWGDARLRPVAVLDEIRRSPILAELAEKVQAALAPGSTLLMSVDDELANLPLHTVPLRGRTWGDVASIGRIPAVGVLRYTDADRGWSGESMIAGDSDGTLPGARRECLRIGTLLGVEPLIGSACTIDAVRARLDRRIDIAHLAVHGRADVRRGGRSSLLFATGGEPAWAGIDALTDLDWRADLIVFSGCSTAVGGPRDGAGLYGVAQAAAAAGATTVLASLWPVNDASAELFMTAFYEELNRRRLAGATSVDLREVMDHARNALRVSMFGGADTGTAPVRDGREIIVQVDGPDEPMPTTDAEVRRMLHWAPFVLLGNPVLIVG